MRGCDLRAGVMRVAMAGLPRVGELTQAELLKLHRRLTRSGRKPMVLNQVVNKAMQRARARTTHPGKRR